MMILIFLATVIPALLLCGFWIKRAKKAMIEERARKLKIAEGKFDELDKPKEKPSRVLNALSKSFAFMQGKGSILKRPSRFFMPGILPSTQAAEELGTPERLEASARISLRPAVENLIVSWREYSGIIPDTRRAFDLYAKCYSAVVNHEKEMKGQLRRGDYPAWMQQFIALCTELRRSGRAYTAQNDELVAHRERWQSNLRRVQDLANSCADYILRHGIDATELSREYRDLWEITSTAIKETECGKVYDPPMPSEPPKPPAPWLEPTSPFAPVEEQLPELLAAARTALKSGQRIMLAHAAVDRAYEEVDKLTGSASHSEPSKPTEPEVQAFLESTFSWGESVQVHVEAARTTLGELHESLREAAVSLAVLKSKDVFSSLRAILADDAAVASLDTEQSANVARWKQIVAKSSNCLSLWQMVNDQKGFLVTATTYELPLTDNASATIRLALSTLETVEQLHARATARSCELPSPESVENAGTTALSQTDVNSIGALRNAIRKLGFAIAQKNAARNKVAAATEQATNLREALAPTMTENNVDKFIRAHRKWCEDLAHNDSVTESRARRLQGLEEQLGMRQEQVDEAAAALRKTLEQLSCANDAEVVPSDLEAAMRAAQMLIEHYGSLQSEEDESATKGVEKPAVAPNAADKGAADAAMAEDISSVSHNRVAPPDAW